LQEVGESIALAAYRADEIADTAKDAIRAGVSYDGSYEKSKWIPRALGYSPTFRERLPVLVASVDIVHVHCLWQLAGWMAAREARKQGKPYVVMPHGFLEPERLKVSRWKKRIMGAIIDRPMLDHAAAVIATSESEAEGIRRYGVKRPIHIMPIGLDMENYKVSACKGKTLLYFSRITPIKGLDMLANVWGQIDRNGWKLLIVGPDDRGYTDEMKRLFARTCPKESYEFRSPVFGEEKFNLLSFVDAFILPTRSENWSIAVAEAMVSGLPVVCTKGAPWGCLNDIKAGWWGDVSEDGLRRGLLDMMRLTNEDRVAYGSRGREWCKQNLSWGKIAKDMSSYYIDCIERYR
jgi:glycosyltransferase involved in cell wall biosynthesis